MFLRSDKQNPYAWNDNCSRMPRKYFCELYTYKCSNIPHNHTFLGSDVWVPSIRISTDSIPSWEGTLYT